MSERSAVPRLFCARYPDEERSLFLFHLSSLRGHEDCGRQPIWPALPAVLAILFCVLGLVGSNASAQGCRANSAAAHAPETLQVADISGAAIERAAVEAQCGADVWNGITAPDGQVVLDLAPGQYQLTVRTPGFATVHQVVNVPGAPLTVVLPVAASSDVVNVTADTGFVPYESNAGSKTNSLLLEVPQSISIVNEREMEARQVITMNEALRYTPGIATDEFGIEPRFDWLKIRGLMRRCSASFATACASTRLPASWIRLSWRASRCCVVRVRCSMAKLLRAA
jgi:Carboxypeptidase regulatory-like domain/TonB-dependent Receptor Plug Domain